MKRILIIAILTVAMLCMSACAGKFELAKKAKALGLDAIHDTVHEMAKDEARHGRAFEGLLKRYFAKELLVEAAKKKTGEIVSKAEDLAKKIIK